MISINQAVFLLLIVSMAVTILYRGVSFSNAVPVNNRPIDKIDRFRSKFYIRKSEENQKNNNEEKHIQISRLEAVKKENISMPKQIEIGGAGIRISRVHKYDDVILVENGCYYQGEDKNKIIVFTNNESDVAMFHENNPVSRNLRMHVKWERQSTSEWKTWLEKSGGVSSEKNVLFFTDNEQPAHCLQDFLFSAFMDRPKGLRFDEYIARSTPGKPCNPDKNWCCFVFSRARVIVPEQPAPFKYPFACYSRLWILMFGRGRFAPEWDIVHPTQKVPVYSNGKGMYPLENLKNLQNQLLNYDDRITLKRKNLPRTIRTNILILDRTEARRRIWQNSKKFVSMIISRWSELSSEKLGSVVFYGASFSELPPIDQARIFHNADVIISPHGAQLSNVIFGEHGRTSLVEILCTDATDYAFSPGNPATLDWNVNFPLRLGMQVWTYTGPNLEDEKCYRNIRAFSIDLDRLFAGLKQSKVFAEKLTEPRKN